MACRLCRPRRELWRMCAAASIVKKGAAQPRKRLPVTSRVHVHRRSVTVRGTPEIVSTCNAGKRLHFLFFFKHAIGGTKEKRDRLPALFTSPCCSFTLSVPTHTLCSHLVSSCGKQMLSQATDCFTHRPPHTLHQVSRRTSRQLYDHLQSGRGQE